MKKIGKIVKWFFIILVVLIGILIAIPFIFKGKLIELAKEEINKTLKAQVDFGEFDLSIFSSFPDLNFEINDVVVVGIDEFEGDTLAGLKQLSIEVGLLSVMGDQIKVKSVIIDHPNIYAKVLPDGLANWDIAIEDADIDSTVTEEPEEELAYKLALKEFKIIEGNIIYDDKDMGVYAEIKNLNFELNGDLAMDITTLNTKTNIEELTVDMEGIKYLNKSKMELIADVDADLENFKFTFKENVFRVNELELGFDGWIAMPDTNIDMDITFEAKKTEFKNILSLVPVVYLSDFNDVKTAGKLALNGFAKGTYNDVQLPAFDLTLIVENAMFKYPDLPGSADNINIDLNLKNEDGNEDHTVINLKKFHIDFAGNPFDMKMLVTTPVSDANIDGSIKGTIDLAKMKDIVPLDDMTMDGIIKSDMEMKGKMSSIENEQYENFHAVGSIVLENFNYKSEDLPQGITISKSEMVFSPQFIELTSFDAIIGKSDMHMNGKIENFLAYYFKDELLKGNFSFNSEFLDLNEFLEDEETTSTTTEGTEAVEEELEVIEIPENIDFILNTSINKLLYDELEITNIAGDLGLNAGKAEMKDLKMNLLDGSMIMNGAYSTEDITKPSFDFNLNINNFNIPKTFDAFNTVQEIAPVAKNCTGNFSMGIDFTGILQQNMEPDLSTVNGTGNFQTKSIVVNNAGIFSKIGELLKSDKFNTMNLSDINFTFKIENGNITVDPFDAKYNKSTIVMGGTQGIDQSINYNMNFNIPSSEFGGAANQVVNNLFSQIGNVGIDVQMPETINFNAIIGGTLENPTVKLDLKDQASNVVDDIKDQVKDKINDEIDKAKAEAIRKAEEQAARLLAEADKKGKQLVAAAEKSAAEIKKTAKTAAKKVKDEAYAQADKLIKKAGNNPIKKAAAKEAAKKIRSEADKKSAKIEKEAATKANGVVNKAKTESGNLNRTAKQQGDKLIEKAKNS